MKKKHADYILLLYFCVLILFGLLVLSSASVAIGIDRFDDPYFFLKRQIFFGIIPGLVLFVVCSKIDTSFWRKNATLIYIAGLVLALMIFIPGIGHSFGTGARSWVKLGAYSFQPSEVLKLVLVISMAAFLSSKHTKLLDLKRGFLVMLGIGLVPIALVALQPDIGTASILFGLLFALLFIARAHMYHMLGLFFAGVAAFALMIKLAPYRVARFMTFLHPELDPQGIGYHINQAFLAVGSGGWFGLGLGHSKQKFAYLPEVHADSIFAIMSEELGFVVVAIFVLFLGLIMLRGFKLAKYARDDYRRLLIAGIIVWFALQSFLNIGAMVGLLPLTGVPLPFVSHGGTALMIAMGAVGILIRASKESGSV